MAGTDTSVVRCSKPDCPVAQTGVCAEGHQPPASCPFYGRDLIDLDDEESIGTEEPEASEITDQVILNSGELLSVEEVDQFLRRRSAIFIAIVGERDSGKTTLVCSLYDRFLKGPFAGHLFAGSHTLIGLEKRSHYSRVDSGREQPDTPRTSISEGLRFSHLSVIGASGHRKRSDLMFSDRAGESYSRARSNPTLIPELTEVSKADRIVILLDGARVINSVERAGAIQAVRQTLRAFLDGGDLGVDTRFQVVLTKVDLLNLHPEADKVRSILSTFYDRLRSDFSSRTAELSFWEIAARDPSGKLPPAHGVDTLFTDWTTPRPALVKKADLDLELTTEFDRLLLRTPMEIIP